MFINIRLTQHVSGIIIQSVLLTMGIMMSETC